MIGRPPRKTAAAEFDVPRSIPMIGMVEAPSDAATTSWKAPICF
jgi:hypothetical protein